MLIRPNEINVLFSKFFLISILYLKTAKFLQPRPNIFTRSVFLRASEYNKVSFVLICLQRLSLIDVAFLPCYHFVLCLRTYTSFVLSNPFFRPYHLFQFILRYILSLSV